MDAAVNITNAVEPPRDRVNGLGRAGYTEVEHRVKFVVTQYRRNYLVSIDYTMK